MMCTRKRIGVVLLAVLLLTTMLLSIASTMADNENNWVTIYTETPDNPEKRAIGYGIPIKEGNKTVIAGPYWSDKSTSDTLFVKAHDGTLQQIFNSFHLMDIAFYSVNGGTFNALKYTCPQKDSIYKVEALDSTGKKVSAKAKAGDLFQIFDDGTVTVKLEIMPMDGLNKADFGKMPGLVLTDDSNNTIVGLCGYSQINGCYWMYIDWYDGKTYGISIPVETATAGPTATASTKPTDSSPQTSEPTGNPAPDPTATPKPIPIPSPTPTPTGFPNCIQGSFKQHGWLKWAFLAVVAVSAAIIVLIFAHRKKQQKDTTVDVVNNDFITETKPPESEPPIQREYTYKLAWHGGYQDGRIYPVDSRITIGRSMDNVITYPEEYPGISRHHAEVWTQDGSLYIRDTSSTGIYLERTSSKLPPQTAVSLQSGDILYFAERKNMVEILADEK